MIWKCSQYSFDAKMPIIMGILNLTPDSFSDGGSYPTPEDAIARGLQMVEEGALIIDVGGESMRPGATPVTEEEECARVLDVVKALASKGICVSIDTRHAPVARAALEAGASIINDVSGFLPWSTWPLRAMRGLWSCIWAAMILERCKMNPSMKTWLLKCAIT